MPKVNTRTIDGVSYNIDHAKKIGKEVFVQSPEFAYHFKDLTDAQRVARLSEIFDQLVAPDPGPARPVSPTSKN